MNIRKPLVIVNFKTYLQGTGKNAVKLSKIAEMVNNKSGIYVAVVPQFTDLATIIKKVSIPVFAQHVDPIWPGSYTGHVLPEAIKQIGAVGTLINHCERRLPMERVKATIDRSRDSGLISVVCADTPEAASKVASFRPDIVAVEPPELIGTGVPVSKAKPDVVMDTVSFVRKVNPTITILCGAGIKNGGDVSAALRLGTEGVLISSAIVKARDPYVALQDIIEAMK
jgi:triosephosphate isomerase